MLSLTTNVLPASPDGVIHSPAAEVTASTRTHALIVGLRAATALRLLQQQALRTDRLCLSLTGVFAGRRVNYVVVVPGGVSTLFERAALLQLLQVAVDP